MRGRSASAAFSCGVVGLALAATAARAADPLELPGRVDAVTVYRGQALVTRVVDVPGPAGLREVVVTGLPDRVVPGSLFAEAAAGVEVRGVRFRTRPVSQDVREDVRKLEGQVRDAQDAQAANARAQQLNGERKAFLDHLEQFAAPTASVELTKGVLNADVLKTLTVFIFDQRQAVATSDLALAKEARDVGERLSLLQRQAGELASGASRTVREAVVFASFAGAGGQVRVKYLVDSANWSPSYVARAGRGAATRPVTVQYDASVQQMTGEDWSDVTMTLSTATPSMIATAPQLDPLAIELAAAPSGGGGGFGGGSYGAQRGELSVQRKALEMARNSTNRGFGGNNLNGGNFGNNAQAAAAPSAVVDAAAAPTAEVTAQQDSELNGLASRLQVLELVAKDAGRESRTGGPHVDQEAVSVTYQLPARTSLPSRADQQSIRIATVPLAGDFYKLAMPVLTSYVYDQATVTNSSKTVLLAGPVASYLDEQYMGTGTLPTVAAGERFTLGFGIDSSLRATRELVDKTDAVQGGNRVINFSYRLAVENFGSAAATVRVVDRLPTSKNQDVKVTVAASPRQPSTQPVGPVPAGAGKHHAGVLNWTVNAPPQAVGEKAETVDYGYKMEFDRQLSITGMVER